ncbi:MAG: complex I NDUFA9 subunit family protein, partial [Caulobacteraceae bacterium]|nr:complex I NDUFA9 subunit family protein [Caulobacter sp.]
MQGLVTVVGGTGFVGRYVVRALARDGWRVRVAARNPGAAPELKVMGEVGQIEFASVNLRDPRRVALAVEDATAVVNLVGILQQGGGQRFEELQSEGAGRLAQAAAEAGVKRFVQISAIGADPRSPSDYARTKAEGEANVRAAFPAATVIRPSIVFGPEDDFFNRFGQMAVISPALPLIGGGKTRMQPVYVGDVGDAVAAALLRDEAAGRTYELGGPAVETFKALMQLLLDETGRRRALVPVPFPVAGLMGKAGDMVASLGLKAP